MSMTQHQVRLILELIKTNQLIDCDTSLITKSNLAILKATRDRHVKDLFDSTEVKLFATDSMLEHETKSESKDIFCLYLTEMEKAHLIEGVKYLKDILINTSPKHKARIDSMNSILEKLTKT